MLEAQQSAELTEKKRVLVVDDNRAVRRILRNYLAAEYEVLEAENGEAALRLASERHPDLIISDLTMPVMDGLEFVRRLRAMAGQVAGLLQRVPVVMLTSLNAEQDCRTAGANDFLTKPVTSARLQAIVQKYLC